MLAIKPWSGAIGAVAIAVAIAGCSMFTAPSVPEEAVSTASAPVPDQPEPPAPSETAAAEVSTDDGDLPAGYIDMGYGINLPADGPGDCAGPADIFIGDRDGTTIVEVLRPENLVDMGPRRFAQGEVGYGSEGRIATYTVAAGDVAGVVGERLCIFNGDLLAMLNGHDLDEPILPGEVLVIDPAAVPGFEYNDPLE